MHTKVNAQRARIAALIINALLVVGVSSFISFWKLGDFSITFFDEGQELQPVQEVHHGGSFLVPTLKGKPYFKKPPLR
ncbi:MAG: hypothetical protein D6808_01450, partial [Candidatus Dadabacteria bacterium]